MRRPSLISIAPVHFILAVLLTVLGGDAVAQRYLVHTYTEADGMPSSNVRSVVQDESGRMWFATRVGVSCYDGAAWTSYSRTDGLRHAGQAHVLVGSDGQVWAVSSDPTPSVARYDGHRWEEITPALKRRLGYTSAELVGVPSGDLLVVGGDGGLFVFDGAGWRDLTPPEGVARVWVLEKVGTRVLAITDSGLFALDPLSGEVSRFTAVPGHRALAFHYDTGGDCLWVVTKDEIGLVEEPLGLAPRWRSIATGLELPFTNANLVAQSDSFGGLYVGELNRLYYFHPDEGLELMTRAHGIVSEEVACVTADRENHLWFASPRGVSKLVSRRFANYGREEGLLDDEVTAIHRMADGRLLLGHEGGLTIFGDSPHTFVFEQEVLSDRVMDIESGPDGRVWLAGSDLGLGVFGDGGATWQEGIDFVVWAVEFASDGVQWIGGKRGLYRRVGEGWEQIEHPDLHGVRRIFASRDGAVYATSGIGGLFRWEAGRVTQWKHPTSHAATSVFCLLERAGGEVWVGTSAGLGRIAGPVLELISTPAIQRPIYSMCEGAGGEVWFGTDNGVVRWHAGESLVYTVEHGLAGREVNREAILLETDGDAWIGTDAGLSHYRRDREDERVSPVVEIQSVKVGEQSMPVRTASVLGSGRSTIVVKFLAACFANERRIRFQTFLEGFDAAWVAPRLIPDRELRYAGLPPGDYRLRIRAIDVYGKVSAEVAAGPWTVLRVWWLRPWALLTAALIVLVLLVLLIGFTTQRRYARRLEVEVAQRSVEIERLQEKRAQTERLESLGLLAGGIAHDFNNLLTGVLGNLALVEADPELPESVRELIVGSREASDRARSLTTQLSTFAKGGAPVRRAADIQEVIRESVSFVLSGSRICASVELADGLWPVEIDPGQMSQVLNNLLLNACEAMPGGGAVTVRGRNVQEAPEPLRRGRFVEIEVEDDGGGVLPEIVPRVFDPYFTTKEHGTGLGLASSYSIIERHEGLLMLEANPGRGAIFRFFLPATDRPVDHREAGDSILAAGEGRILVMDDEEYVRRVIAKMLSHLGYSCVTVSDGEEAIAAYASAQEASDPFALVIMDLTIRGGLGGLEASTRLRQLDSDVKMVVVSGYSDDPVIAHYESHGFVAELGKPFRPDELARVLNGVLME